MLKYVLNVVIYLALAVWIGSLVFFGAGVAPLLFQPDMLPSRTIAGAVNSAMLGRLGTIEIISGVLLVGGAFYTAIRYLHPLNWIVLVLSVGMLVTAAYYNHSLFPTMNEQRIGIGDFDNVASEKLTLRADFDKGHKLYSTLVKGVLATGVVVLILHTIAFVRYTELHARRYRDLEQRWRLSGSAEGQQEKLQSKSTDSEEETSPLTTPSKKAVALKDG